MDIFLTIFVSAMLLGSTIGLALGIPAALRLRNGTVILRSMFGAIVGTILGILLAWAAFEIQSGLMHGNGDRFMRGGLMWILWVLPGIVSVTAIIVGELAIFIYERSQPRKPVRRDRKF